MRYVILLLMSFVGNLHAAPELMIPFYTKHVQYKEHKDYTEDFDNTSIGLNWSFESAEVSAAWVSKNSHSKESLYGSAIAYPLGNTIKFGGGILVAVGGYDMPMLMSPVIAIKYGKVRIVTTMPLGYMLDNDFDLINIQLMIPME